MALPNERHLTIDTDLQHMVDYLTSLASEIDAVAPLADHHGFTYQVAINAARQVAHLRRMLGYAQECKWVEQEKHLPFPLRAHRQSQR
jgi:hypothetical protein